MQEAEGEARGSANATGENTGECKNTIERGKWSHPSSRHSYHSPAPCSSLIARRVRHPSSRHSCNCPARRNTLGLRTTSLVGEDTRESSCFIRIRESDAVRLEESATMITLQS
jgi:hypothetical protein